MRFEDKIKLLAIMFDLSITSWIRSKNHNAAVGGVARSRHLVGLAVDIVLDATAKEGAEFVTMAKEFGLQVILEGDHFHVQEPRE